ncbi:beta-ketoacyl-[acyl-carrier-protein] synthase family protein [Blastopirellula sediminis]|nr:beta-ketoacyl-[acyl-carrier-protein] synthase family protein [Blastopirellula sediminis]
MISHLPTEPVVITGIGMITSIGRDRESTWRAAQRGECGIRRMTNLGPIPDNMVLGAPVDLPNQNPDVMKPMQLNDIAAEEAMRDSQIDLSDVDLDRFGCAISGHMGDAAGRSVIEGRKINWITTGNQWWKQLYPNTSCGQIANRYGLMGPRICHSTACASGLVDMLSAVRAIRDNQCDIALVGSGETIDPLFAAGFRSMRVLSDSEDPKNSCRPFDKNRNGFVMGEGSAMFVIERLSHAMARGAKIYAEILGCRCLSEAHHVTGLDMESIALERLLTDTLRVSDLTPRDIEYVNCHGTGTKQNDINEIRGIRGAFGIQAQRTCVSSLKSMLGHLVNASGSVELAITTLALRDGFIPPTSNLRTPDPECDLDCIPQVGRQLKAQHALKLSVAFGGHLVAVAIRRWNKAASGFGYPEEIRRAA